MKRIFIFIFISICFSSQLISQKVYAVPYASQADAILYETKNKSEADILIYKVGYASQEDANKGLWYEVLYASQADWRIYWAKYKSQADCVVYFVDYRSQAQANDCYLKRVPKK
jgi:hypothetical protein